jgi:hypothetical protein
MDHRGPLAALYGVAALTLCVSLVACGEPTPEPPAQPSSTSGATTEAESGPSVYEQDYVFASVTGDSVFLVPWMMKSTVRPDSVVRETRGWLSRGGAWEAFFADRWATPPTRVPSRVLPHGDLKLLVQDGDVIDGIIFEQGARRLELSLGDVQASWAGPRGESIELDDGAAYLSDQRVEGLVMHMARASAGEAPPGGDWALLVSGDSMRAVLAADSEYGGDTEPVFRGWMDLGSEERLFPDVRVDWEATQAFPPARRDVPVSWRIRSDDETISGDLDVVSSDIEAGTGPGPLLPVRALYSVTGSISTADGSYPVRGLLVHERR